MIEVELGRWDDNAPNVLPHEGHVWSSGNTGRPVHVLMNGNRTMATVRWNASAKLWMARIEGFEWKITSDMAAARFQDVPSSTPVTHTPIKAFTKVAQGRTEIEAIIKAMPVPQPKTDPVEKANRLRDFSIELDCPPGQIRPENLIADVLKETGLSVEDFDTEKPFFGNQTWVLKPVGKDEIFTAAKPTLNERITALYYAGLIRWGSW